MEQNIGLIWSCCKLYLVWRSKQKVVAWANFVADFLYGGMGLVSSFLSLNIIKNYETTHNDLTNFVSNFWLRKLPPKLNNDQAVFCLLSFCSEIVHADLLLCFFSQCDDSDLLWGIRKINYLPYFLHIYQNGHGT